MTERDLLEAAAKAADAGICFYGECWRGQNGHEWNPLTDDGDALRLAVKLGINLSFCHATAMCTATNPWNGVEYFEPSGEYRRSIVMAAAEIGRSMS
jgi:hypothetical protein